MPWSSGKRKGDLPPPEGKGGGKKGRGDVVFSSLQEGTKGLSRKRDNTQGEGQFWFNSLYP